MSRVTLLLFALLTLASFPIAVTAVDDDTCAEEQHEQEEQKRLLKKKLVTVELYGRAETDLMFTKYLHAAQAFTRFFHIRELTAVDVKEKQKIVRMNRDTLYSVAIIDFAKCTPSGVKIVFPPSDVIGERYVNAQVISQSHESVASKYPTDDDDRRTGINFTRGDVGTDKAWLMIRTFTDGSGGDLRQAHAVQDAFRIAPINDIEGDEESCDEARLEFLQSAQMWDQQSLATVRDLLKSLQTHSSVTPAKYFGANRDSLNFIYYLFGVATGWGGLPASESMYFFGPTDPDVNTNGHVAYQMAISNKNLPLKRNLKTGKFLGFWSITVYDKDGFMVPNALSVYNINSATVAYVGDTANITFAPEATCVASPTNCLPITPSWNYIIRMYIPDQSLIDGSYKMPKLRRVEP